MIEKFLHNTRLQILTIAGMVLLLYLRTLSFDFIGLDEESLLVDKKDFNKELLNIPKTFKQDVFQSRIKERSSGAIKYYRPLLTISFILNEQFSKGGFSIYRLTNILIHILATIGLLFVFQQLKIPQPLAFFFSLLFAVHPLLVQAIAWIPGRNDSIVCAFILWSFYFLLKTGNKNPLPHLLLFTCALFTKENAIVFAPICIYYVLLVQKNNFDLRRKLILFSSYAIIITLWLLARNNATGESLNTGGNNIGSLYHSFLKSAPLLFQYFQKTILPLNLSVMSIVSDTSYGWVLLAFILFGTAIYFTKNIQWAEITFGLLWFFLFFLPTLLFSYFEGMEHRSYLPMAGLFIAFAHTEPLLKIVQNSKKLLLIFGPVILIFGTITFTRVGIFSSELKYWENAFYSSKHSSVVCRDYGIILTKTGEYAKAEQAYLEGIRRNPKEILVHYNLGVLYLNVKQFAQAEDQLRQELALDSTTNAMTYHVLGIIYKQTGRMNQATTMWKKALMINPNFQPAKEELQKKTGGHLPLAIGTTIGNEHFVSDLI